MFAILHKEISQPLILSNLKLRYINFCIFCLMSVVKFTTIQKNTTFTKKIPIFATFSCTVSLSSTTLALRKQSAYGQQKNHL